MSARPVPDRLGRWLAITASVVVGATLLVAIMLIGSPSAQREANLDGRRIDDLNHIDQLLDEHLSIHGALPPNLVTLAKQPGRTLSIVDPVDGKPYEYQVTGAHRYRLCAVFATDTSEITATTRSWPADAWTHGEGRQCFDRNATLRSKQ
ncbi:MAG: hypothetical protein ABIO75_02265 [Thermomonas sp.]